MRARPSSLRTALLAGVLAAPAAAAEVPLESRIDRVTVFPDAALVTRAAAVALPAGASTLVLRGLPAVADPGSVRVEGEGDFAIGAVDLRIVPGEARPNSDPELERRILALRDERERVAARLQAVEGRKRVVERFGQAGPDRTGPEGRPLDVAQWAGAWEAIGTALAAVAEDARALNASARDLDAQIAALERARPPAPRPGAPRRDVTVAVEAGAALSGTVRVSYRVTGASWAPAYDARLETGAAGRAPALDLARRAIVQQRTGEDWSDVALSVSTTRVNRGSGPPELPPLQIDFYQPPVPPPMPAPMARSTRSLEAPMTAEPARPAPLDEARQKAVEVQAAVEATPFQVSYAVPGRVAVPADGSQKSLLLGRTSPKPTLSVTATPVLDETAYLTAGFTSEDQAPLLPGEVTLLRDGAFVGRARMKLTAAGETVELGFGADDAVRVTRVPVRRRENEPTWIGQTKTDQREFKTTVRNLHRWPIRIVVLDRVPYSENTAITVETTRETTTPSDKQVGDRRGVMAWSYEYGPGETREIRLAYRLRWPAERDVTTTPRPVGPGPRS